MEALCQKTEYSACFLSSPAPSFRSEYLLQNTGKKGLVFFKKILYFGNPSYSGKLLLFLG